MNDNLMRRRKLLISIGALGAGGTAAFGTEAFTSVEADRNVDIDVAGDASAFLSLAATGSANSEDYVDVEDDETLEINLDGDNNSIDGVGVNNDAITIIEDLFKILNQGTQPVNIYIEDNSDAVTFQSEASSIEDPSNSIELDVGTEIIIGIKVDTTTQAFLSNNTSESLIDSATIVGNANRSRSSTTEFDLVVAEDGQGDDVGEFSTLTDALDNAEENDIIGIRSGTYDESVTIDVESLTLEAADGASPTVTQNEAIPVLVEESGVTVDDSITFESEIDVGADFSDYSPEFDESGADAVVGNTSNSADYDSIGAALAGEGANTDIFVRSDEYDSSNEDANLAGDDSALISIVDENVRVVSEAGPEATAITPNKDRIVDIEAAGVVFQGFDIQDAEAEAIFLRNLNQRASGIEITDNKIETVRNGIVLGGGFAGDVATEGAVVENNEITVGSGSPAIGISLTDDENPKIRQNTITGASNAIQIIDGSINQGQGDVVNTVIEANQIESNGDGLVLLAGSSGAVSVDTLSNNQFIDNDKAIETLESAEVTVNDNWFGTEDEDDVRAQFDESGGSITLNSWAGAPIDPDDPPA